MHAKCSNKNCQFDHDVLQSVHNRKIIDGRDLSWIPVQVLHGITRASANPSRSVILKNDFFRESIVIDQIF